MPIPSIPKEWLYPPTLADAAKLQTILSERVDLRDDPLLANVTLWGGVDVSNNPRDPSELVYAAVVSLTTPGFQVQSAAGATGKTAMPYVPGYLAFREIPILLEAIAALPTLPQVILVDGHGISHPRGLGIASQLGVLLDMPTIGVAKNKLFGHIEGELGEAAGSTVPLVHQDRQIGTVLRSKARSNPLIIAPGHRVSHDTAVALVQTALQGYRLPEPTRQAHLASNRVRRGENPLPEVVTTDQLSLRF